jgi:HEAT repeat protein
MRTMTALHLLAAVPVLRLTLWFTLASVLTSFVLTAILVAEHVKWTHDGRRRERARAELEPIVSGLLGTKDPVRAAAELHAIVAGLGPTERAVAATLVIDLAQHASQTEREALRRLLDGAGAVELAERGTHRRSPWRRALACETLGKIGAADSVPVLLERLDDRRPEVRIAAVRALGELGSPDVARALTTAFLERRCAPTAVVNDALRKLEDAGAVAFDRGSRSDDAVVRVSSCYGLAATASLDPSGTRRRLVTVLSSDTDPAVRTAAAAALGIVGGTSAPGELVAATQDGDVRVRRAAAKALGSFDEPAAIESLAVMTDDDDRETALRAAEALLALSARSLAGPAARAQLAASTSWSVRYAQVVAEIVG